MKKAIILFSVFSIFFANAQTAPTIQWQKSFGGIEFDWASFGQQTSDGGYIVAGTSISNNGDITGNHGAQDVWIMKCNNIGTIKWQKSLGGTDYDSAQSVQQTTDGGYIVAATTKSYDGDVSGNNVGIWKYSYWIVKLDNNGNIQWQKALGGTSNDFAYSVQQTTDSGYIVAGASTSNDGDVSGNHGNWDYWVVKLDSNGNIQWQKSLGGSGKDTAYSVQQTNEGGYIIVGESWSNNGDVSGNHGSADCWIVKLDSTGSIEWQKSLGGSSMDKAYSIKQTTDSGYIVVGFAYSNDGDLTENNGLSDCWVVKLDNNGSIQWQKSFGGTGNDDAASIQQTTDGGYIVGGVSTSNDGDVSGNHGGVDYWIVKLNNSGSIQWQKSFGGTNDDVTKTIQQTTDGGFVVIGESSSNDGDVSGNHGWSDLWILKLSAEGLATQEVQNTKINIYPNPIKDILYFSEEVSNIRITDISGRMVKEISVKGKSVNIANLAIGNYIVTAVAKSGETITKKIVKE